MSETDSRIDDRIATFSRESESKLQSIRRMVHATAKNLPNIAGVEECLKWGQPSFITVPKTAGSTIRIDGHDKGVSVYFTCSTNLVSTFRELYPNTFNFVGNREIRFDINGEIPEEELKHCLALALTYHIRKKK